MIHSLGSVVYIISDFKGNQHFCVKFNLISLVYNHICINIWQNISD
jgi:hypothetical protein